jgi:hypothetical protein
MRRSAVFSAIGLGALVTLAGMLRAQSLQVNVPDAVPPGPTLDAIVLAKRALADFVVACAARDAKGIARVTTGDAEIEYALEQPGRYLAVDANATGECWGGTPRFASEGVVSELWIYPTAHPSLLFVHFIVKGVKDSSSQKSERIAVVKMSGDHIAKIRYFPGVD